MSLPNPSPFGYSYFQGRISRACREYYAEHVPALCFAIKEICDFGLKLLTLTRAGYAENYWTFLRSSALLLDSSLLLSEFLSGLRRISLLDPKPSRDLGLLSVLVGRALF